MRYSRHMLQQEIDLEQRLKQDQDQGFYSVIRTVKRNKQLRSGLDLNLKYRVKSKHYSNGKTSGSKRVMSVTTMVTTLPRNSRRSETEETTHYAAGKYSVEVKTTGSECTKIKRTSQPGSYIQYWKRSQVIKSKLRSSPNSKRGLAKEAKLHLTFLTTSGG